MVRGKKQMMTRWKTPVVGAFTVRKEEQKNENETDKCSHLGNNVFNAKSTRQ